MLVSVGEASEHKLTHVPFELVIKEIDDTPLQQIQWMPFFVQKIPFEMAQDFRCDVGEIVGQIGTIRDF